MIRFCMHMLYVPNQTIVVTVSGCVSAQWLTQAACKRETLVCRFKTHMSAVSAVRFKQASKAVFRDCSVGAAAASECRIHRLIDPIFVARRLETHLDWPCRAASAPQYPPQMPLSCGVTSPLAAVQEREQIPLTIYPHGMSSVHGLANGGEVWWLAI